MPTPLSLGFDITLQKASEESKGGKPRSIAVICGWLGAKPRQLRVFVDFYNSRGYDVISFAVGPSHVLFPKTALAHMQKVLDLALAPVSPSVLPSERIVFHHFSVGGYLFGRMLEVLKADSVIASPKYSDLIGRVKAQVFDSPPDIAGVPAGLAASMGIRNVVAAKGIELAVRGYLAATASTSGVEHAAASLSFHENYVSAPSLWFFSKADPVANYKDCETVIGKWRQRGTTVETCVWEDSKHIQHARKDPARYFDTLQSFLVRHRAL